MRTHKDLVSEWGTQEMADDLGTTYGVVASWKQRNAIPYEWFVKIVVMAPLAGFPQISLEFLHALQRGPTQNAKSTKPKKNARRGERTPA